MRDYIIRRLLILVPVMIGVSLLTFSLFNVIPGDACVLEARVRLDATKRWRTAGSSMGLTNRSSRFRSTRTSRLSTSATVNTAIG